MSLRKQFCVVTLLFLGVVYSYAQANLLNATKASQVGVKLKEKIAADNDKPLPYEYVDNRDILWSKVVWEFVDFNQKINFPYYFPVDTTNVSKDRRSLFDTLLKGIRSGEIKDVFADSFLRAKLSEKEINEKLINVKQNGDYYDTLRISSQDIEGLLIKGIWYFDKRHSELKYRPLALAPMGKDVLTLGVEEVEDNELYELFWVFYPSARNVLFDAKVFNPKSIAQPISYDHLINARRFNAVIVKEENIYGNREISDYIKDNSLLQLLEARKIKESIRDREMDMWNY